MINLQLPPLRDISWAIFGRHPTQDSFIERLHREGCPAPIVVVSPEDNYARDRRLLIEHGLFGSLDQLVSEGKARLYEFADVNDPECLRMLIEQECHVVLSTACRNIIKKPLIDHFEGRIFNLHGASLPRERGGALNTWRILNDVRDVGSTLHLVEEGVDSGPIVFQHSVTVDKPQPLPIDYDLAMGASARRVFGDFCDALATNQPLVCVPQNADESLYLPRLYTELNGAIDLDWPIWDIERFIRAFSDPYPGAFSFVKDEKIHFHDARIEQERGFHPFCNGRVVTVLGDGKARIVAGGGLILVREVTRGGHRGPAGKLLKARQTLRTPAPVLHEARTMTTHVYAMK